MDLQKALLIKESILRHLGVNVVVEPKSEGLRAGLSAYFSDLTRQGGPIFEVTPYGLKRHRINVKFGNYAGPCIEQIQKTATKDNYILTRSIIDVLAGAFIMRSPP